jgi:hypothetical protein
MLVGRRDSYIISNLMGQVYGRGVPHLYENTNYVLRRLSLPMALIIWKYYYDAPMCVPSFQSNYPLFTYSMKELLVYLYDKIESN